MGYASFYNEPILPWSKTENDVRFNKVLKRSLLFFLLLILIIPFLPIPEIEKKELKQVSPRLAKLVIQKKQQKVATNKPAAKKKSAKKKPAKKKAKKAKKKSKKPSIKKKARKKAASSGLMALTDELADLRDSFNVSSVQTTNLSTKGKTKSKLAASNILTSKAGRGSGGINTNSLSNQTGGGSLSGRSLTGVSSNIGSGGTGTRRTAGGKAGRSQEEIERVFQRNKGSIFAIYNRALRKDPSLQGKVVLALTILPNGKVTKVRIVSTDLNAKGMERKLRIKVKSFRFADKDVATVTVTYPIDFFPS